MIADIALTDSAKEAIEADRHIQFTKCDVTNWNDLQSLFDVSRDKFADVPDVIVASAGVFEPVRQDTTLGEPTNC